MITRVTNQTLMRSAQRNLQDSMTQMAKLQDTATSLKKIGRPSDDPIGTADSMRVRAEQTANAQYGRNISDAESWLTIVDSALSKSSDLVRQIRDLTVQGANDGAMSPAAREAIAVEMESLRSELMSVANTSFQGRTVFAGTSDEGVAFRDDLSFTGTGTAVERRVNADTTVRVDANGQEVFGVGPNSVFALVDNIIADLRSGTNVGVRLGEIDTRASAVIGTHGTVGARHAQVLRAKEANVEQFVALEGQRSGIEDVDLGKIVLDLKLQEITYQSALAVTARVLQPTLMDFLR